MKQILTVLAILALLIGVQTQELCKKNPCKNQGVCSIDKTMKAKCTCTKEFTGPLCEVRIATTPSPIQNSNSSVKAITQLVSKLATDSTKRAVLIRQKGCDLCSSGEATVSCKLSSDNSTPICECAKGYSGTYCETRVSPCDPNPCLNNGFCVSDLKNVSFSCVCSSDYAGKTCEKKNVCGKNPCLNKGYCVNFGESYTCSCPSQYFGTNCEKKNPCADKPCSQHGICIGNVEDETYKCVCSPGFTGKYCNETDPCSLNPCKNDGICRTYRTSQDTSYKCICFVPWTGTNCESKIDTCVDMFESCSKLDSLCPVLGMVCKKTCTKC